MAGKQPTPVITDLFRFVTVRTPQLIGEDKKKWGFIFHPKPSASHFLKEANENNLDKSREVVRGAADTFKPVGSTADIKNISPDLYHFAGWLTRNRNVLLEEDVASKTNGLQRLSQEQLVWIWDNLFYQICQGDNPMTRQACIQMITADNFLQVKSNDRIKEIAEAQVQTPKTPAPPPSAVRLSLFLRRIAKAKLVIPKAFSVSKQETESDKPTASPKTSNQALRRSSSGSVSSGAASSGDTVLFGVNKIGIGVLRKVEQEVCCYVPGEVSRIENILAREYKERQTRSLISTETTTEDTTEVEVENQSDTVSTSRNELQSEIANSLTKDNSINTGASLGVTAQGKFFGSGGSVTSEGNFDFASNISSSASDSAAQTYAQEVTNSALDRVLQKTTQKRTSRILQEYEENNRHGFDNRQGTEHVTGVYRWVDIIYTNRLINYGKQLMFEFLIPEPARFYRDVLKKKGKKKNKKAKAPKPLSDFEVSNASNITEENYLELGRTYDVTLPDPVSPATLNITKSFAPTDDPDAKERSYTYNMLFAEFGDLSAYLASSAKVSFNFDYHLKTGGTHTEDGTYFILKVYDKTYRYDKDGADNNKDTKDTYQLEDSPGTSKSTSSNKPGSETITLPNIKNELSPISVQIKNVYNFSINITVTLAVDPAVKTDWQNEVYDKLVTAYEDQLDEFENSSGEDNKQDSSSTTSNPDFNRTIEQRELQRIAIELLTKPFGLQVGKDFYYESNQCKVPQVKQNQAWEKYASRVKFFEQAFDWQYMAYLFYPYYWADKCDWRDLFQLEPSDDPIFQSFLQSGMSRMVVPVRKGFEEAVNYFLETGDIWNGGGLVMDTDDDLYLSIDEELQEMEGFVDQEWQTRVPTTLTIVQGKSVYLEDEGLPCCDKEEENNVDTLLRPSTAILGQTASTS